MQVLFVGNSFFSHDSGGNPALQVTAQFAAMAKLAGRDVVAETISISQGSLQDHWDANSVNSARNKITSGNYDLVIMVGSTDDVLDVYDDVSGARTRFDKYTDLMADLCVSSGSASMFVSSWMRTNQIGFPGGSTVGNLSDGLYSEAAWRNGNSYAPTVAAWVEAHRQLTLIHGNGDGGATAESMLYDDAIHPSKLGSYLVASTLFAMAFHEMPPPASTYRPAGVSLSDAELMRKLGWAAALEHGKSADILGSSGNNDLHGTAFGEAIQGLAGQDDLFGGRGDDRLFGHSGHDRLEGNAGSDRLHGGTSDDRLLGGGGKDTLIGGLGRDTLTGGIDVDTFIFTGSGATHWDMITDFEHGIDEIAIDGEAFGLESGALRAGLLAFGARAVDANDRLIYDRTSGGLYFDSDGTGQAAKQMIAMLDPGTRLTADDIFVA